MEGVQAKKNKVRPDVDQSGRVAGKRGGGGKSRFPTPGLLGREARTKGVQSGKELEGEGGVNWVRQWLLVKAATNSQRL